MVMDYTSTVGTCARCGAVVTLNPYSHEGGECPGPPSCPGCNAMIDFCDMQEHIAECDRAFPLLRPEPNPPLLVPLRLGDEVQLTYPDGRTTRGKVVSQRQHSCTVEFEDSRCAFMIPLG